MVGGGTFQAPAEDFVSSGTTRELHNSKRGFPSWHPEKAIKPTPFARGGHSFDVPSLPFISVVCDQHK